MTHSEDYIKQKGFIVFTSKEDFEGFLKLLIDNPEVDHDKPYSNYRGIPVMFNVKLLK